jgi:predicted nucleic acid-binding protein
MRGHVDALYSELAASLDAASLITTDARLARSDARAELIVDVSLSGNDILDAPEK